MNQPKILAFAGSLRNASCNKKLIRIATDAARKAGAEVTLIDLRDFPLPLYDQEIEDSEGLSAHAKKLKELLNAHQGFLISSPEYNSSISAVTKNLIDWASRKTSSDEPELQCFRGKTAALLSASPSFMGGLRGLVHLRAILGNIGTLVIPEQKSIANAYEAFESNGELINSKNKEAVDQVAIKLVETLKKLN
jgi:chromate reductase, NAD(P)H dehydrogenase (quinone)